MVSTSTCAPLDGRYGCVYGRVRCGYGVGVVNSGYGVMLSISGMVLVSNMPEALF